MTTTPRQLVSDRPLAKPSSRACPVVCIGASAGGLEAIEAFLTGVAPDSGMAYVVIQHLDPDHDDMLAELLQRGTRLPVAQVAGDEAIEPDHVYVIPPGADLGMDDDRLRLEPAQRAGGVHLPIDSFLHALARERGERGIAVILSGSGSDGTLGIRAIKEQGGIVAVQEPGSASFDSMPRGAIETGFVDAVAPPGTLPQRILDALANPAARAVPAAPAHPEAAALPPEDLARVLSLLQTRAGRDFSQYKPNSIERRIQKRMGVHQLSSAADYVEFLERNEAETELLVNELLIGVTSFFRDPELWEAMRDRVIPALLDAHPRGGELRAWVAGCSTGEEAYSLAMAFLEVVERGDVSPRCSLKVFATDLDAAAIEHARHGRYPASIADAVPAEQLEACFTERDGGYQVQPRIREMIVFAEHDVTQDPPFTRLDLVACRNVLIYFTPVLQERVLGSFHYALVPRGLLVLGTAESVSVTPGLFDPEPDAPQVFRARDSADVAVERAYPYVTPPPVVQPPGDGPASDVPTIESLVTRLVVRDHSPTAVLTNADGDIRFISAKSSDFLEPAVGVSQLNIFSMARPELGEVLLETFQVAVHDSTNTVTRAVEFEDPRGERRAIDITVRPLAEPEQLRGMVLVVFDEVAPVEGGFAPAADVSRDDLLAGLGRELQACRDRARQLREETQASREALMSANEELQSTNEELSTSREELQSTNEELRTINGELQAKLVELSRASDDMRNLLDSTDIAILFLDEELCVRRFTAQARQVMRLQASDLGRPFTDLVCDLDYPSMADDAASSLTSREILEREVRASGDRWFVVRMIPYHTREGMVDGIVITFADTTTTTKLELQLRSLQAELETRVADQRVELVDARRQIDDEQRRQP